MYVDLVTTWNELQTGENTKPLAAVGFSLTVWGLQEYVGSISSFPLALHLLLSIQFMCISLANDMIAVELPINQSTLIKGKHITAEADKPVAPQLN